MYFKGFKRNNLYIRSLSITFSQNTSNLRSLLLKLENSTVSLDESSSHLQNHNAMIYIVKVIFRFLFSWGANLRENSFDVEICETYIDLFHWVSVKQVVANDIPGIDIHYSDNIKYTMILKMLSIQISQ